MNIPKVMYIFPGQGSQYKGMGRDICRDFKAARQTYEKASNVLGYDLADLSFNDPEGKLDLTEFTQLALLTHSIACLESFKELTGDRVHAAVAAGHSLGEYSALVAAGTLTFENALRLVQERGRLMSAYGRGKMVAIGLDLEHIKALAADFYCDVGGCNLPDQTVVGGLEDDLKIFVEHVKTQLKRPAIYLNTEGAFHTYHMIAAAEHFRPVLEETDFKPPSFHVLSNHTGKYHLHDPSTIKAHLFFQLFTPVRWIWGMQHALRDGVNVFVEFGGGINASDDPASVRPNLEKITMKAFRDAHYQGSYLPAITSATIRASTQRLLEMHRLEVCESTNASAPRPR